MKPLLRISLWLLLCGLSLNAHAEWTRVANFERAEFYIDKKTINIKGDQREVWSMMNYHSPQMDSKNHIFRSTRSMLQMECPSRYARVIHTAYFTDFMLRGEEIGKMGALPRWEPVPSDSPMNEILDLVCRS